MEKYDEKQKLALGEGQGMKWFSFEETKELKIAKYDKKVIEYMKTHFSKYFK